MLHLIQKARTDTSSSLSLTLTFEQRSKSRLRATLDDGQDVAVLLDRGEHLHAGDILQTKEGETVRVHAADERVSIVVCENTHLLARACYHLGNRHVALQIAPSELRYRHDHVLDEMLKLLGLSVKVCDASFEPESGAYGAHAHGDNHDHHGHEH